MGYRLFCLFGLLALGCLPVQAQQITRGPYLQNATEDAISILWRTDTLCTSRIRYGASPGNLNLSWSSTTVQTYNHISADHRFRIRIRSIFMRPASTTIDWRATTVRTISIRIRFAGTAQPIKIWALGDFGRDNAQEYLVRDSYVRLAKGRPSGRCLALAW
jgi:hypothetical protein